MPFGRGVQLKCMTRKRIAIYIIYIYLFYCRVQTPKSLLVFVVYTCAVAVSVRPDTKHGRLNTYDTHTLLHTT